MPRSPAPPPPADIPWGLPRWLAEARALAHTLTAWCDDATLHTPDGLDTLAADADHFARTARKAASWLRHEGAPTEPEPTLGVPDGGEPVAPEGPAEPAIPEPTP